MPSFTAPLNPLADMAGDGTPQPNALLGTPPTLADGWEANAKAYGDWVASQRASGVAAGMLDPTTGWPTQNALLDAARQYGGALIGSTTAPGEANIGAMDPVQHMLEQISAAPKAKWGIRVTPEPVSVKSGETLPPSRVWDDGEPTDQLLPGTSTVGVIGSNRASLEAALGQAGVAPYGKPWSYYPGQHVALVQGATWKKGYDDGERLIPDAKVVATYLKADDKASHLLPIPPK